MYLPHLLLHTASHRAAPPQAATSSTANSRALEKVGQREKSAWSQPLKDTLDAHFSDDAVIARRIALEETMMHEMLKFDDDAQAKDEAPPRQLLLGASTVTLIKL
jgi:hypothetical protein